MLQFVCDTCTWLAAACTMPRLAEGPQQPHHRCPVMITSPPNSGQSRQSPVHGLHGAWYSPSKLAHPAEHRAEDTGPSRPSWGPAGPSLEALEGPPGTASLAAPASKVFAQTKNTVMPFGEGPLPSASSLRGPGPRPGCLRLCADVGS